MKKYLIIIIGILSLILELLVYVNRNTVLKIKKDNYDNEQNLSLFVEQEDGNYIINNDFSWQERGYNLNTKMSSCSDGGNLSWNTTTRHVVLTSNISNNCKLYFEFEKDKYIKDLSGNGYNGEFNNVIKDNDGLKINQGYINTYITNHDFSKGLSFIVKLKVHDFSTGMAIMGNWEGKKGGGLYYASSKYICFDLYELVPTGICSIKPYVEDIFYTIVGTYDNKTIKLYVINDENVDVSSVPASGIVTTQEVAPIVIGMDPDIVNGELLGHNNSDIIVSDALIFNKCLTEEEIRSDYLNEINPHNNENLLLWYQFH